MDYIFTAEHVTDAVFSALTFWFGWKMRGYWDAAEQPRRKARK
jgi:hypothetical protein